MRPPPLRTRCGATARMALQVPVRFTSIWSCQSASSHSRIGLKDWMPALANRMSSLPNAAWGLFGGGAQVCQVALIEPGLAPPRPGGGDEASRFRQFVGGGGRDFEGGTDGAGNVDAHHVGALAGKGDRCCPPIPRAAPVTIAALPLSRPEPVLRETCFAT